jgi:Domain of unknown function (DUF4389)
MSDMASYQAAEAGHPVRLVVTDDLRRSRLTVFFRLLLAIPHVVWISLWGIVAFVVAVVGWFAALFGGRLPDGMHDFLARFLRYATHVTAYTFLVADPFPGFKGEPGSYPVDLEIDGPTDQSRLTVGFRIILAIPALILANVLGYLLEVLAFVGWFYALFTGRMSRGIRDLSAYCLRYTMQTYAYVLLLTGKYPSLSGGPIAP